MSQLSADVRRFLAPPRLARLATTNADGSPHVVPVWYLIDGDAFLITTRSGRVTARNIVRDGRVAMVVDTEDNSPHCPCVTVEGRAAMAPELAERVAREVAVRYLGPEAGTAYAEKMLADRGRSAFRVQSEKIRSMNLPGPSGKGAR
ncbi:MAG: TIGR03618 family F420-dependent PPOX class oxidoreductase [Armatimonadetes bacterium]|nr:TIGR03618 family F420-dependent PPOX class oxidoreductase [Armatimonadota bacterium]